MRYLKILNCILAMSVVGLVGCATTGFKGRDDTSVYQPPGGGSGSEEIKIEDVMFRFDQSGNLVPVSVNGKPFITCGQNERKDCKVFREGITVLEIDSIDITIIKHKRSPECVLMISRRGSGALGGSVSSEACLD
jgi:hypothetical protein